MWNYTRKAGWDVADVPRLDPQPCPGHFQGMPTPTGPDFIHPHPPTPENTLLGVGGVFKGGGRIKFTSRGGLKIYTPTPLPWKCLLARNGGGGGGRIQFLPGRPPNSFVFFVSRILLPKKLSPDLLLIKSI